MKFEEVLPALREGKKITSELLLKDCGYQYIYYRKGTMFNNEGGYWHLTGYSLVEIDDWEIVKETKKVKLRDLSVKQFITYCNENSHKNKCNNCIFKNVVCDDWRDSCWINHKDLYSNKFLDQEIEIEVEK